NSLCQGKNQGKHMLRHNRPVHLTCVGQDDIAVHQLGKQKLVHGGSRRMDPAKPLRYPELLGTKRKCEGNVGIREFLLDAVVGRHSYNFKLRELFAEILDKPLGGYPEVKAMIGGDEKLAHRLCGENGHCELSGDANMIRCPSMVIRPNSLIPGPHFEW